MSGVQWWVGYLELEHPNFEAFFVPKLWSCQVASNTDLSTHLETWRLWKMVLWLVLHWGASTASLLHLMTWWCDLRASCNSEGPASVIPQSLAQLRKIELCCPSLRPDCERERLNHSLIKFFKEPVVLSVPYSIVAEINWQETSQRETESTCVLW